MNRIRIGFSVGNNGKNQRQDVLAIQKAINYAIKCNLLVPFIPLKEDGIVGKKTTAAISRLQQVSLRISMPDGRIDPGGRTLEKLNHILSNSNNNNRPSASASKIDLLKLPSALLTESFRLPVDSKSDFFLGKTPHPLLDLKLNFLTKEDFVKKVYEAAKRESLISGVPAAITTAQAILETGFGKSVPTDIHTKKYSYNLFGIKGVGPAGSVEVYTHEFINGNRIKITDKFQAYHSFSESITGRTKEPLKNYLFLKNNHPYKRIFKNSAQFPVDFHFTACNLPFWQMTGGLPLGQQARFHA